MFKSTGPLPQKPTWAVKTVTWLRYCNQLTLSLRLRNRNQHNISYSAQHLIFSFLVANSKFCLETLASHTHIFSFYKVEGRFPFLGRNGGVEGIFQANELGIVYQSDWQGGLASHWSGRNWHSGAQRCYLSIMAAQLPAANEVSSCSFPPRHLAGFLSLMDLKWMDPRSLPLLALWQSQHILGNWAGS